MRRFALLTALAVLALAAPAASASSVFVVNGRGFGHGIGMSQYGAYGYALHHVGYRRILAHYYKGTTLGTVPNRNIRVLLQQAGSISFSNASSVNGTALDPSKTYTASPQGSGTVVRDSSGHTVATFGPGALYVSGSGGSFTLAGAALNGTSGGAYRGQLEIAADSGRLDAIDVVSLEDYVAGVVPGEMVPSWPLEALKVQAVAARTYALATHESGLFDQFADTRSQEYKGLSGETSHSNAAVNATAGQVVLYRGSVAITYFFSTSGGRTEDIQNVFYGSAREPYLVSVRDPYDSIAPLHKWRFRWSAQQIQSKLGGLCKGSFRRIKVLRRGRSPRIVSANVVCSGGKTRVTGVQLKTALGLYDTWFYVTRVSTRAVHRASSAEFIARFLTPPRAIAGTFDPAPASHRLTVEQKIHGRFVGIGSATTADDGSFMYAVRSAGVYRVSSGGAVSDPIAVS